MAPIAVTLNGETIAEITTPVRGVSLRTEHGEKTYTQFPPDVKSVSLDFDPIEADNLDLIEARAAQERRERVEGAVPPSVEFERVSKDEAQDSAPPDLEPESPEEPSPPPEDSVTPPDDSVVPPDEDSSDENTPSTFTSSSPTGGSPSASGGFF